MIETEVKKFETLEPGIRAFLLEGESLRPANTADFTTYAHYDGLACRHYRKAQADAPGLSVKDVHYGRDVCEGNGNKFAEPFSETDYCRLPPAFVVAAALDPLHDDCFDCAARLATVFFRARNMSKPVRESFDAIIVACASLAHQGRLPD